MLNRIIPTIKTIHTINSTQTTPPSLQFVFKKDDALKNFDEQINNFRNLLESNVSTLQSKARAENNHIIIEYIGFENVIIAINRFFDEKLNLTTLGYIVTRLQAFQQTCKLAYHEWKHAQIIIIPDYEKFIINPISPSQNKLLFLYLDQYTQNVFHQGVSYTTSDFTFTLTHSLLKKARLHKNTLQPKLHPITQQPTYTYLVYSREILGKGASSTLYYLTGRVKPVNAADMDQKVYLPYPVIGKEHPQYSKNIKVIKITFANGITPTLQAALSNIQNEYAIMQKNSYLNPGPLIYEYQNGVPITAFIPQNTIPYTEFFDFLAKEVKNKSIVDRLLIAIKLLEALHDFHQKGFIHRDIKPENMFIDKDTYQIYLIDFGYSVEQSQAKQSSTFGGTLFYLAPELMFGNNSHCSTQADVFSIACVLRILFQDKSLNLSTDETTFLQTKLFHFTARTSPEIELEEAIQNQLEKNDYALLRQTLSQMNHGHPADRATLSDALNTFTALYEHVKHYAPTSAATTFIVDPTKAFADLEKNQQHKNEIYTAIKKMGNTVLYQDEDYLFENDTSTSHFFKLTHTLIPFDHDSKQNQFSYEVCAFNPNHFKNINTYIKSIGTLTFTNDSKQPPVYSPHQTPKLIRVVQVKNLIEYMHLISNEYKMIQGSSLGFSVVCKNSTNDPKNRIVYLLQDQVKLIMFSKFINDIHEQSKFFPISTLLTICINLLTELHELYQRTKLVHRNLHPNNVVIDLNTYQVGFINFSQAIQEQDIKFNKVFMNHPLYLDPHVAIGKLENQTHQSDIFAIGMMLRHLFFDQVFVYQDTSLANNHTLLKERAEQLNHMPVTSIGFKPFINQLGKYHTELCILLNKLSHASPINRSLEKAKMELIRIRNELEQAHINPLTATTTSASLFQTPHTITCSNAATPIIKIKKIKKEKGKRHSLHITSRFSFWANMELTDQEPRKSVSLDQKSQQAIKKITFLNQ